MLQATRSEINSRIFQYHDEKRAHKYLSNLSRIAKAASSGNNSGNSSYNLFAPPSAQIRIRAALQKYTKNLNKTVAKNQTNKQTAWEITILPQERSESRQVPVEDDEHVRESGAAVGRGGRRIREEEGRRMSHQLHSWNVRLFNRSVRGEIREDYERFFQILWRNIKIREAQRTFAFAFACDDKSIFNLRLDSGSFLFDFFLTRSLSLSSVNWNLYFVWD